MKLHSVLLAACALFTNAAHAQTAPENIVKQSVATSSTRSWPSLPPRMPAWLESKRNHEVFYRRGNYNFAIYQLPVLARDMNGVAVGHAMAYEALVTGRANSLETTVFKRIIRVLQNPPKLMPAERFISPTFGRKYGVLELVFDWTHTAHAQTIDNLVSTKADHARKDRETSALWNYYKNEGAPFLITGLPMNMAWLDSQPYSGAFRKKYPKVNALFWGYHWLQTSVYDGLRGKSRSEQQKAYAMLGARYRNVELYDVKRPFMPMMAETSPLFSAQYPEIANTFDNLHMLHDMVNDILATDEMSDSQKKAQIKRAVFIMSPDAHRDCKAGENRGVIDGLSHDHRFMQGMRGMGLMKNGLHEIADHTATHTATPSSTRSSDASLEMHTAVHAGEMSHAKAPQDEQDEAEATVFDPTELMWMPIMGWMNMSLCHHCSMPLAGNGEAKSEAWQASTVTGEGWTMRVRCALCARDMSAETKGGAILNLATEDPNVRVVVFSDDEGNLTTEFKGAVFLEERSSHARCSQWSQAFTSKAAFDIYVKNNPKFADAKMLTFEKWAQVEADATPDTYFKESGPVDNPYAQDVRAQSETIEESVADIETPNEKTADENLAKEEMEHGK